VNRFIARQPIFDTNNNVYGYELLYREGARNCYVGENSGGRADANSSSLIVDIRRVGLRALTDGKKAFVNFTDTLILSEAGAEAAFANEDIVAEVLESVLPTAEVVRACRGLKRARYQIALDDFEYSREYAPLIELADIVKIDFLAEPPARIARAARLTRLANPRARLLAEKVETRQMYELARELGFAYFQGYFLSKPVILEARKKKKSEAGFEV